MGVNRDIIHTIVMLHEIYQSLNFQAKIIKPHIQTGIHQDISNRLPHKRGCSSVYSRCFRPIGSKLRSLVGIFFGDLFSFIFFKLRD